jgi:cytochrome c oxidase assembly protein subunit 15
LTALFLLGGLQGALGWYMVASGLVDNPQVSPYRLTAHLRLAVLIYGYMLWLALGLLYPERAPALDRPALRAVVWSIVGLVFVTIITGGFVAGTRAGFAFNTFPLMQGRWLPEGLYMLSPWWRDLFENVATVQFHHRLLAYALVIAVPLLWLSARRRRLPERAGSAAHLLLAAVLLQVALGIATLVYVVPIPLAAAHQGGALLVLSAAIALAQALRARHSVTKPKGERVLG